MQAVTVSSELTKGFFNEETAREVGIRLWQTLGDEPFTVFTKANRTQNAGVRRLVGGDRAVTVRPEATRSCLLLNTTSGYVELRFGSHHRNRDFTYEFTAQGNLLVSQAGDPVSITVVMPLRSPKQPPGGGRGVVSNVDYTLNSGLVDELALKLAARLEGRAVVHAYSDIASGLDRYGFPVVTEVWVGEGFDSRLILEVEGDIDSPDMPDHVFLLGEGEDANAEGEWLSMMLFGNGSIRIRRRSNNSVYHATHLYWAVPC